MAQGRDFVAAGADTRGAIANGSWPSPMRNPRVSARDLGPAVREHGALAGSNLGGTWELPAEAIPVNAAHYVLPDSCADVIFSIDSEGRIEALAIGPAAFFGVFPIAPGRDYVGARVRAGFGSPILSTLRDHRAARISIRETRLPLVPSRPLATEEARIWLAERLSALTSGPREAPPVWVAEAMRLAGADDGDQANSASEIARRVGVSQRTLHRGFLHWVGLSPKRVMRVERAKHAARQLASGRPAADAAACLHFSDQAHMTRELRAILGVLPAQISRGGVVADLFKNLRA